MKKLKKTAALIFAAVAVLSFIFSLSGCKNGESVSQTQAGSDEKTSVVCTAFAQYDWVRNVLGSRADKFNLILLGGNGTDMHSYQPGAEDMKTIGSAALLVYVGGISESWIEDVLRTVGAGNVQTLNLMSLLSDSVREEETALEAEDHDHEHEDGEDETEYDEHVWLSLRNAEKGVSAIAEKLSVIDSEGKSEYESNAAAYTAKLKELDGEYKAAVQAAKRNTVIFADRFPFLYLIKDYSLNYYAAFSGCSAESEASFQTVAFLADKADEIDAPAVIITETSDGGIADTVIANTQKKTCQKTVMNSMQSVKTTQLDSVSYLDVMRDNLTALKTALG